jgi:hypothetical protein
VTSCGCAAGTDGLDAIQQVCTFSRVRHRAMTAATVSFYPVFTGLLAGFGGSGPGGGSGVRGRPGTPGPGPGPGPVKIWPGARCPRPIFLIARGILRPRTKGSEGAIAASVIRSS